MATKKSIQQTIYSELLRNCSEDFEEAIILLKAKELIKFVASESDQKQEQSRFRRPGFSLRTGRIPFDLLETDIAMNDGGWRVMGKENDLMTDYYEEYSDPISTQFYIDNWNEEHAA